MKLKNLTIKTIPYIATLTLVFGMTGCSGSDNNKENNTTTEYTTSAQGEDETTMNIADSDNDNTDNVGSGNEADTTGGDAVGGGEQDTTSGTNNNASSGNAGNNSSNGGTGSSNNSGTVSNSSGNGSGSSGNAGSSNNSGSGNSGSGSSSNNNSGSSSNGSSSSGNTAKFVETKSETTYKYASTKVDSYTTKYTTTEVFTVYDLYSDGSKIYDGYEFMCSEKEVGTLTVMVKETDIYTDINMTYDISSKYSISDMGTECVQIYNKWKDDNFGHDKTNGVFHTYKYCIRNSDNVKFSSAEVLLGDNAARALVKELGLDNKSVTKEKRLYDLLYWLENNVTYSLNHDSVYECLVEKKAKCHGYATTICHVLSYTDISVKYTLSGSLNHAWNIVQLDDGNWYHLDGTRGVYVSRGCVQDKGSNITSLSVSLPYLILGVDIREISDREVRNYDVYTSNYSSRYTGTINYATRNNIKLNYPVIDTTENGKHTDSNVYIKGSDLTH